jgi:hypothetical protein
MGYFSVCGLLPWLLEENPSSRLATPADGINSQDHRGTPEAPGRVVTLIERSFWETLPDQHPSADKVWGVAYRIEAQHVQEVKEYLDIREINGYTIVSRSIVCPRMALPSPAPSPRLTWRGSTRPTRIHPQSSASLRGLRTCLG